MEESKSSSQPLTFTAFTETWLYPHISDAQIHIKGYTVSRCDRDGRGGGVCLYTDENIPISREYRFDDGICQCLIIMLPVTKYCIIVIYRPPDANLKSFSSMCSFINDILVDLEDSCQVILTGDLNFPMINWNEMQVSSNQGLDVKLQLANFLE